MISVYQRASALISVLFSKKHLKRKENQYIMAAIGYFGDPETLSELVSGSTLGETAAMLREMEQ